MFWPLVMILIIAWMTGLAFEVGGTIHLLLIIVLIILIIKLLTGKPAG